MEKNLLYMVSEYDTGILCAFHVLGWIKIRKMDITFRLLEYCMIHDYMDIITFCMNLNKYITFPTREILQLIDVSVTHNSIQSVKWIHLHFHSQIDSYIIGEYIKYAIENDFKEITYFLLDFTNVRRLNIDYDELIYEAIQMDDPDLIEYILNLDNMYESYDYENHNLISAIELERSHIVQIMCKHVKINPHEPDNLPVRIALENGNDNIVQNMIGNDWVLRGLG